MLYLEEKCQGMEIGVNIFFNKFEVLKKRGLQRMFVINDKLITLYYYNNKLIYISKYGSKFAGILGSIIGKAFLEALQNDLSIQHEVNHIFFIKPTFSNYIEVDEIYKRVNKLSTLSEDIWENLCELLN